MSVGGAAARRGRQAVARPLLHVTNGESAGETLRRTDLGGAVLPWRDVLHDGPVPSLPRRRLLEVRASFLAGCGWGNRAALLASLERRDRQLLDALRDGLRVVLWLEHDLSTSCSCSTCSRSCASTGRRPRRS